MTPIKSLLLGAAAGFFAASSGQAADLPSKKSAPAEYVRVCNAYGAGFFYIPGTETCLHVGGRVRTEYAVAERFNGLAGTQDQDLYGFRVRSRVIIDSRTQTAYGVLRTFIRLEGTVSNGVYNQGLVSIGPGFTGTRGGAGGNVFDLDKAFVQFGPITAGRAQSFFDGYTNDLNYGIIRGSAIDINLLAYTATFGGGFSATLSLEDRSEREVAGNFPLAGQTYPDLVGSLNLTQGWGSAQLSGALTQRNSFAPGVGDKVGFAVQGTTKINLPFLAKGDYLWLQAAYSEGAISYLGYGGAGPSVQGFGSGSRAGRISVANSDSNIATIGGVTTQKLTKGYALTAGLLHYWTPQIRQGLYGSYSQLDYSASLGAAANTDPKESRIGSNLIWSPVTGLDIGVEVIYARVALRSAVPALGAVPGTLIKSDDSVSGRLRIQRDF